MRKTFTILGLFVATALTAQNNLVPNHSFENWSEGVPAEWYVPSSVTVEQSSTAHDGSFSVGIPSRDGGNNQINPLVDIPVTQGVTYVFSGWYLDNTPDAKFRYWAQFRTETNDTGANPMQGSEYSVDSPEWKFFSAEAQPNAGAIVIRAGLRVYNEGENFGGKVLLDDIKVYDKSSMGVSDLNSFDKQVMMNTVVNDVLTLKLPKRSTVNIYSMDGRIISSNRVDNGGSINLQSYTKGTYVVTVSDGINTVSRKIVKK